MMDVAAALGPRSLSRAAAAVGDAGHAFFSSGDAATGHRRLGDHASGWGPNRRHLGIESYDRVTLHNWSRGTVFTPEITFFPRSTEEVQTIVRRANAAGKRITIMGKGHSWNPLMAGADYLICTVNMSAILHVDKARHLATVESGATIAEVEDALELQGFCVPGNIVGTRNITFGGLMATGSHGSGRACQPMSDLMVDVEMVLPSGEVRVFSEEASGKEVMDALRLNLGLFGVMTRVTFKVEPTFLVEATDRTVPLDEVFDQLPSALRDYESVEVLWFPFTDRATFKLWNRTGKARGRWPHPRGTWKWLQRGLGYAVFQFYISKKLVEDPSSTPRLMRRFSPLAFPPGTSILTVSEAIHYVNEAERFPINETEIAIGFDGPEDLSSVRAAWNAMIETVFSDAENGKFALNIIAHMRFSAGSTAYMSPAYGHRRTAWLDFASYYKCPGWQEVVDQVWSRWREIPGVRLHWAKEMQRYAGLDLGQMYGAEAVAKFLALRAQLDPNGVFLHDLAKQLFGLSAPP